MEASLLNEISFPRIYVERTLAIIKPDAIDKSEEIEDIILTSGFTILQKRKLQLSPEQCSDFYTEHHGKLTFPKLTAYMSSGPIIALTLARDNAIAHWKAIIGPIKATESHQESLRAKYATSELENALHGSESFHVAEREIKFMFPNRILYTFCVALTVPTREETEEYLSRYVNQTLLQGLTELCKHKPLNPCVSKVHTYMYSSLLHGNVYVYSHHTFDRSGLPSGSSRTIQTSLKYVTELLWKEQSDIRGLGGSKYGIKSGILTKALSVQVTDPLFIERDLGYPAFVFEIHHPII
ncbi:nucleoside diphosphate kinase homolog 5-like isoform X2 [Syngnathoides biaculeatus]|uniref:nucleoside diphosphate kinase homolog 5-like isoform X2 n=1 Tax=Syngnathoides biaculeatus TaxID=300417 RepID=UPI002ADE4CA2|nr:nucleoside diphosphate kinase homolog 5-like isoform X2 [Syngnathoides biaculeatus]